MDSSSEQVNGMNKKLLIASVFLVYAIGYGFAYATAGQAYAQYMGNIGDKGETGVGTLEEALVLARRRIEAAEANPASGSGTPYLDASGVIGASIIAGAVFGGIATAFFVRSRSGKYAAYGRG